jgi:hypothetical protein
MRVSQYDGVDLPPVGARTQEPAGEQPRADADVDEQAKSIGFQE